MPTPDWKVHTVVERGTTDIAIADVLIDGRLDFYPEVIGSDFFNFSYKGDKLNLVAGNYVGFVPLNDRLAILVEPKIGRDNWIHIIGKARGDLRALDFIARYSRLDKTSQSLLEFLGNVFLRQLESIDKEGLYRQYSSGHEVTESPHGRIMFEDSIRRVWSRRALKNPLAAKTDRAGAPLRRP